MYLLPLESSPPRAFSKNRHSVSICIAERACGGCHAIAGRPGSTVQGTAAPSFGAIAGRPNQTSQRLQSFIMTPHRPMPGIPLSLAEVNDVVAYILSLK